MITLVVLVALLLMTRGREIGEGSKAVPFGVMFVLAVFIRLMGWHRYGPWARRLEQRTPPPKIHRSWWNDRDPPRGP